MADTTVSENALLMAYNLKLASEKLSNYAQLIFTVAEAFEANEDTAAHGWALRPIAEGIQDLGDDCMKTLSVMREDDDAEEVA